MMVPSSSKKTKSVLIVDDDLTFGALLKTALESEDAETVVAVNAADASAELGKRRFDLIILDGELPDQNGMDWLAGNLEAVGDTPVMFVSASWRDTDSHMRLVNELGVRCIVHKPVSLEVLVDESLRIVRSDARPIHRAEVSLAELAMTYVVEMTGEFKRISDVVRYGDAAEIANADWRELTNAAHKIRGTAGVFEFYSISKIAASLENALKSVVQTGTLPADVREIILESLDRAAEEVTNAKVSSQNKYDQIASEYKYHDRIAGASAKKVLIADDDKFFLKRLEQLLAAEGILLNAFSDSAQVLEAVEVFHPELVVLDVNMPGKSGFDVCQELKQKHPDIPIILISADDSEATRAKAAQLGAVQFIRKPIKNSRFVSTINGVLNAES